MRKRIWIQSLFSSYWENSVWCEKLQTEQLQPHRLSVSLQVIWESDSWTIPVTVLTAKWYCAQRRCSDASVLPTCCITVTATCSKSRLLQEDGSHLGKCSFHTTLWLCLFKATALLGTPSHSPFSGSTHPLEVSNGDSRSNDKYKNTCFPNSQYIWDSRNRGLLFCFVLLEIL